MLHSCVDITFRSSGRLIVIGFLDVHLLTTSTSSIIKMNIAPVSAMA